MCEKKINDDKKEILLESEDGFKFYLCSDCYQKLSETLKEKHIKKIESEQQSEPKQINHKEEDEKIVSFAVKCFDCGKDLLHSKKEYFFDEGIGERVILCPDCWKIRRRDYSMSKKLENIAKPSKKLNYNNIIYRFIIFVLIALIIVTFWSFFMNAIDNDLNLDKINNEIEDAKNELNSLNNEITYAENDLSEIKSEVQLLQSGKRYELKNPTYSEVLSFLSNDKTNNNEYSSGYTCAFFSKDVNNNAEQKGIRCAYVELEYDDVTYAGHSIVAFETTDKGLVYFEPQHDVRANVRVGSRFYSCLAQLPGYLPWEAPSYDDTIKSIVNFW